MTRSAAVAVIWAACAACSWQNTEPEATGPRGVPRSGAKDPTAVPLPVAEEGPLVPTQAPVTEAPVEAAAEEEKKRDYGAEILQALGSPVECLAPRAAGDAPPAISIDVEAYVMPSGGVGRGYARSSTLREEELTCVRRRIEAIRLAPPIEEAPRRVSTTLKLELQQAGNPGR